jgi:1-acyl-sn-glycerol-3-phosphate acyltransferase
MRRLIDRLFGLLARLVALMFHRILEFDSVASLRAPGPRLVVVNHFNGFMDVLIVTAALGRLPRFVGKATLANVIVARPFLRLAGVVLVHRRGDGSAGARNKGAFAACERRLAAGDCVVIFPEGTTHDRESLAEVRTGAARIALSARQHGVSTLRLIPVGLTYGDKTRLRNRALVAAGTPITIPNTALGDDDHDAVRTLTDDIATAIDALVPGVDDPLRAWAHERAALVYGQSGRGSTGLAEVLRIARRTLDAPEPSRLSIERAIADYGLALDLAGVDDVTLTEGERRLVSRTIVYAVGTWLLAPVIAAAVLMNAPAVALVAFVDLFVRVPVTKGTVRALVALVAFPATWLIVAAIGVDGVAWVTLAALGNALALLLTVWLIEGDVVLVSRWVARHRAIQAAARLPAVRERRDAVVRAVTAALGSLGTTEA